MRGMDASAVGLEDSSERIVPGRKESEINMKCRGKKRFITASCMVFILHDFLKFGIRLKRNDNE